MWEEDSIGGWPDQSRRPERARTWRRLSCGARWADRSEWGEGSWPAPISAAGRSEAHAVVLSRVAQPAPKVIRKDRKWTGWGVQGLFRDVPSYNDRERHAQWDKSYIGTQYAAWRLMMRSFVECQYVRLGSCFNIPSVPTGCRFVIVRWSDSYFF